MKRILGLFMIAAVGLLCSSVGARTWKYPTADMAVCPNKMTGEELVALLLTETDQTLEIVWTRITSEVHLPPGAHIRRTITLRSCLFEKDINFEGCTFSGNADFGWSTFLGNANFRGSTFSGNAVFTSETFSGNVIFQGSTFSGPAQFERSIFSGNADFWWSTFSRLASFTYATFSGNADFVMSRFSDYSDFTRSTFWGNGDFMGSTFSGMTVFAFAHWYCIVGDSIEPMPGTANFTATRWADELHMENMNTRPGVALDFKGAKWDSIPKTQQGESRPVLFITDADYDKFLFPAADEGIPHPLLGFGVYELDVGIGNVGISNVIISGSASSCTGWRVQVPEPDKIQWPVIQRTYGKFLTFLKESGRYDDYDALFTEFHDLETHYKWYKGDCLGSGFNFMMGLICGYGIRPIKAFWFSLRVVLVSAFIYLVFRKHVRPRYGPDEENAFQPPYFLCSTESRPSKYDPPQKLRSYRFSLSHFWPKDIKLMRMAWWLIIWRIFVVLRGAWLIFWYLMNFVLFSVNTFCTVGYDNNYPVKGLRYVCMAELVLGYVTLTLFLVSLVNILIR